MLSVRMQFKILCQKRFSVFLFIMIKFCVTQRSHFNGIEFSSGNSYPFCAWPTNISATECNSSISLSCVIHGCYHGPAIVVGDRVFTQPEDNLKIICVRQPDSTGLDGTLVANLTLNISDIAQSWNSSEPVPMYCATGSNGSKVAHLLIPSYCSNPVTNLTSTKVISPSQTSGIEFSSGNSYPFCAWPANITAIQECDESISFTCVIHGCHHGPSIAVGGHVFTPEHNLNITCVQQPDSTGLEGTLVVHLMQNISDIAKSWNSSEPVPIYCATGSNRSKVAHLLIPTHCSDSITSLPSSAIIPSITPTPLSATVTVSPTPQNSAYGMESFSVMFTIILSFNCAFIL